MKPRPDIPLTPAMEAVIERMVRTQSVGLVRVHSQWWAAENDCPITFMQPAPAEIGAVPRAQRDQLMFDKPVFWTGTVVALVNRGRLRFAGPKVKKKGSPAESPPYRKAVFRH